MGIANEQDKRNTVWAYIIGMGLALSVVHNQAVTAATTAQGQVWLFLPAIGTVLWITGTAFALIENRRNLSAGSLWLFIPLVGIALSLGFSAVVGGTSGIQENIALFAFGLCLLSVYVVGHTVGGKVFLPLSVGAIVVSLGVILYGVTRPGLPTGGVVFESNYDIAAGFILFGLLVSPLKHRWWMAGVAVVGVFFSGAPEGLFILAVLSLTLLARRDWSRKAMLGIAVVLTVVALWTAMGYTAKLAAYPRWILGIDSQYPQHLPDSDYPWEKPISGRWELNKRALDNVSISGHGYTLGKFSAETVHNVPLVIVDQVGPIAALLWVWATVYCIIKTRWKYAWLGIVAMGVFDHYIWTQAAPWWWALAGASTVSTTRKDLVFR